MKIGKLLLAATLLTMMQLAGVSAQAQTTPGPASQPKKGKTTSASQKKAAARNTAAAAPNQTSNSGNASAKETQEQAIQDVALNPLDNNLSDYVPCEFTISELLQLRAAPEVALLTDSDSEILKQKVISVARSGQFDKPLAQVVANYFILLIVKESFAGLTQTQALARVIADYSNSSSFNSSASTVALQEVGRTYSKSPNSAYTSLLNGLAPSNVQTTLSELRNLSKAPSPDDSKAASELIQDYDKLSTAGQATIVDAAREQTAASLRPKDVSCAMNPLNYRETRSAYGSLVANNYIAVQIMVRNLNDKYDFQIHDAELAVDSDPGGRHGRFFSGSDRRIVRSFSVAQESFDARNLSVNLAQAGGALLSSISPIFGGSFADAVGVITGGAIPGLGKVWKDQTTDQLNLLSDTALNPGAGGTSVPRHGVSVFVMFVPSVFYEMGWWTLDCATEAYIGSKQGTNFIRSGQQHGLAGLDLDRILEPCLDPQVSNGSGVENHGIQWINPSPSSTATDLFIKTKPKHFKDWSGSTLAIFRELSFVTVSGVHTVEQSELQPGASKLSCTPDVDAKGNITFDGTDTIVCVVSGKNLGTVTKLRLRNASDPSDLLDVALNPTSGDPSSGTVKFNAAELAKLKGTAYNVLIVDKKDTETKTSVAMHFITTLNPVKITPDPLNLDTADQKVTIAGSHLDKVTVIKLARDDKTGQTATISISNPEANMFSFSIPDADATKLGDLSTGVKIDVTVSATGETDSKPLTFTVTKTQPAAKPKLKPAAAPAPMAPKGAKGTAAIGKGGKTEKSNAGTPALKTQ